MGRSGYNIPTLTTEVPSPVEEISMFIENWKRELISVPNMLSLFRIMIIPVYIKLYLNAQTTVQYIAAGTLITLSCLTDMLDGFIARRFNMITALGKILDPLADKITQLALMLCLNQKFTELTVVMILFLIKEILQTAFALFNMRKGKILSGALIAGKICTTVLFISLIVLVFFPNISPVLVRIIANADLIFLIISFLCYLLAYQDSSLYFEDIQHW
jgi:cardiolipin synthase